MKILVFGAGGIGSVIGGFLARTGHDVSLLGRSWHMDAVRQKGLRITGLWGDYHIKALETYGSLARLAGKEFDLIFLTVKAFDTEKAVEELKTLMHPKTTLVSFQNGLGNIETVLRSIPSEQFIPGRVIFGVEINPGEVKITVNADDVILGALPGSIPNKNPITIAKMLSDAKVPARAVTNILTHIWSKVIYNCALNGICTVEGIPYGKILENERTRSVMEEVVRECYAVAQKKGVVLEPSAPSEYIEWLIKKLIPSTASHYPSMLQDLKKGKRIDIDSLNGAICQLGFELQVSTPANTEVVNGVSTKTA